MKDHLKSRTLIGLLCLGSAFLGALLRSSLPPAAAQAIAPSLSTSSGRYCIAATQDRLYFADTQTGQVWYYATGLVISD